jgi:hypothetical protein
MRFLPLPPDGVIDGQPTAGTLDRPPIPRVVRRWQRGRIEMRSLFITPMAAQFQALTAALADLLLPALPISTRSSWTSALPERCLCCWPRLRARP